MSQVNTIKVSNVSLKATDKDLKEFFSFSKGNLLLTIPNITRIRSNSPILLCSDDHHNSQGATIVDLAVTISLDPYYKLPQSVLAAMENESKDPADPDSALRKAEDVVSSMLAKGYILGKDAVNKAKAFDEKHQLTSTGLAKVASFDKTIGLTDKISTSVTVMGDKVREVDQKYQVTEKTKSALAVAEQTVSTAGSKIMKNRYVFTSAAWVTGAFSRVAKAAEDVGQKAKEKAAEGEERKEVVDDDRSDKQKEAKKEEQKEKLGEGMNQQLTAVDHPKSPSSKSAAPIQ